MKWRHLFYSYAHFTHSFTSPEQNTMAMNPTHMYILFSKKHMNTCIFSDFIVIPFFAGSCVGSLMFYGYSITITHTYKLCESSSLMKSRPKETNKKIKTLHLHSYMQHKPWLLQIYLSMIVNLIIIAATTLSFFSAVKKVKLCVDQTHTSCRCVCITSHIIITYRQFTFFWKANFHRCTFVLTILLNNRVISAPCIFLQFSKWWNHYSKRSCKLERYNNIATRNSYP